MASSLEVVSGFFELQYHSILLYYFTNSSPSLTSKKHVPKELLLPTNLNNSLFLKTQVLGKDKPLRRRMTCASKAILSHLPQYGVSWRKKGEKKSGLL